MRIKGILTLGMLLLSGCSDGISPSQDPVAARGRAVVSHVTNEWIRIEWFEVGFCDDGTVLWRKKR